MVSTSVSSIVVTSYHTFSATGIHLFVILSVSVHLLEEDCQSAMERLQMQSQCCQHREEIQDLLSLCM